MFTRDRALETRTSADVTATANGTLFKLPAGNAGQRCASAGPPSASTESAGVKARRRRTRSAAPAGVASINLDLPISRRNREFSALGNLTLNANAEVDQLSDFGTLTIIGAGANWSPVERLSLITSWTCEEGAPTIQQLGDPIIETPGLACSTSRLARRP